MLTIVSLAILGSALGGTAFGYWLKGFEQKVAQ